MDQRGLRESAIPVSLSSSLQTLVVVSALPIGLHFSQMVFF